MMDIVQYDHKKRFPETQMADVRSFSQIRYAVFEKNLNDYIEERDLHRKHEFDALTGKIVASAVFKIGNAGRGVNIVTLYDQDNVVVKVETEGAFVYAYTRSQKIKLTQFMRNTWYSVYVALDLTKNQYSLFLDGVCELRNADTMIQADSINQVTYGSNGGILTVDKLFVYRNPVQNHHVEGKKIYDVKEYGMLGQKDTVITEQLQKLLDECGNNGGGVIYLHDGVYKTGSIVLKSNTTLYIDTDAVLQGVLDINSYPTKVSERYPNMNMIDRGPQKALIYAEGEHDIAIMGGGVIDGSGDFYGAYRSESTRPSGILMLGCTNVVLADLHIMNAGMWTIPLVETDNVYIRDLNIDSCWYPNRDGVDFCDCINVLIENCNIKADDDALCYKSGNESGCVNILARNINLESTMANGIKFGTYSYGGFFNCTCEDIVIKYCRICAICVECVDGGTAENLMFERIKIENVENPFFVIVGNNARTPYWCEPRIGRINNIYFKDIDVENVDSNLGNYIGGYKKDGVVYPVQNVTFDTVAVKTKGGATYKPVIESEFENRYAEAHCFGLLPASVFFVRHAANVQFQNCILDVMGDDVRDKIVIVE